MDFLALLYALYLSYYQEVAPTKVLLTFTEFQEKLSQQLIMDDHAKELNVTHKIPLDTHQKAW